VGEKIDDLVNEGDELLSVSAANHVAAGRVKISAPALAKAGRHPLAILDATLHDEVDPLRTAALCGVALGLDIGRTVSKPMRRSVNANRR
jgi:hypothetical protein